MDIGQRQQNQVSVNSAFLEQRALLVSLAIFSFFVNILVLTGPIFALQVYDRVLGGGSIETLVALASIATFLFIIMGLLDHLRRRLAVRIGERMYSRLEAPVFDAVLAARTSLPANSGDPLRDLDMLRGFFASAVFIAAFDIPWVAVFLIAIAWFHPVLGLVGLFGAAVILLPGLIGFCLARSARHLRRSNEKAISFWSGIARHNRGAVFGMDLKNTAFRRWQKLQHTDRLSAIRTTDRSAALFTFMQTFRVFLQSCIIGIGAYLVLNDHLTAGTIIAASVLLARALTPADLISQNAATLRQVSAAWRRLSDFVGANSQTVPPAPSIRPNAKLNVKKLTVFPTGSSNAALRMVNFDVAPGQSLGIAGASGAGKSSLVKSLIGQWPATGGDIKYGGVPVGRFSEAELHRHIGLLPQELRFQTGTIHENICLFAVDADLDSTVISSNRVGAHDLIVGLPHGYETMIGEGQNQLPGGLLQKIGLARAIYRHPKLLILDEPGNNMDADGLKSLNDTIRSVCDAGGSAVVLSQRSVTLSACDKILLLSRGKLEPSKRQLDIRSLGQVTNQEYPPLTAAGQRA